jgi:capsular exopolysaccharide synthesis family protein
MSHVRNLLHAPVGRVPSPSAPHASVPPPHLVHTDLARTDSETSLSSVPVMDAHVDYASRIVCHTDPRSSGADRYRLLRMRLRERHAAGKLKTVLITSPLPQDGKSTATMNLATVLAERGKHSVLVIEGDLHRPSLGERLSINTERSLTECLQTGANPLSALVRLEPLGWYLLPAGQSRKNPTELLQTPAFGAAIQKLSSVFDWILIDSPPVLSITDALLLQPHADAALLVVRAGQASREAVEQAVGLLGANRIAGMILNGIERGKKDAYYYYGKNPSDGTR